MKDSNKKILSDVYTALSGVASEQGSQAFDQFYKGGGKKLFKDLEKVLSDECGIDFVEPEYKVVPMKSKKGDGPNGEDFFWKGKYMIVDQTGAMVLTGMTKADAEWTLENVVKKA